MHFWRPLKNLKNSFYKEPATFLSGDSDWPEINASELYFGLSCQGHPTWPYLECGEQHLFYRKLAPASIFHFLSSSFFACCRREKNIGMNITLFAATVGSGFEETARQENDFCKMVFCRYWWIDFFATLDFINSCMGQKSTSRALDLSKACQVSINSTKGIECILLRSLIDNCFICHLINTWRRKSNWTKN